MVTFIAALMSLKCIPTTLFKPGFLTVEKNIEKLQQEIPITVTPSNFSPKHPKVLNNFLDYHSRIIAFFQGVFLGFCRIHRVIYRITIYYLAYE